MEVKAIVRGLRITPRKVRLVIGLVRGMEVNAALAQLKFLDKKAARPITKLIRSAMANAENNFKLDPNELYIKNIFADAGAVLDRWRARAFGRAAPIHKRMSHVTVVLEELAAKSGKTKADKKKVKESTAPKAEKKVAKKVVKKATKKATKE